MRIIKTISIVLATVFAVFSFASCNKDNQQTQSETEKSEISEGIKVTMKDIVLAEIEMDDGGIIKLELYHNIAPITVENFVSLAESGFYNGLIFHRVINNFMIQGGDPDGIGTGGPGYSIKGEFALNGIQNDISHVRGVISMARRSNSYDSAGSQFFIVQADSTYLDYQYAGFGRVTEGMDIVDKIASVATDNYNKPYEDQVIKTIRITDK